MSGGDTGRNGDGRLLPTHPSIICSWTTTPPTSLLSSPSASSSPPTQANPYRSDSARLSVAMSEDPVWRFLASEFASLRSQITTMSTSEAALLVLSLAAPGLLLLYGLFLAVVPDVSPTRPEELLFCSAEDLKHLRPLPLPLDPTRGPSPPSKIALSVVVPAFNEKLRLPAMLDEVHAFLSAPGTTRQEAFGAVPSSLRDWEVIVVDDGSEDGTDLVALTVGHEWVVKGWSQTGKGIGKGEIRVVKLENNRGKGGAVKHVRCSLSPSAHDRN